jgi:hypothetical protein
MKTYKQFSEDMKKNFQTFLNNPETQDLLGRVKNTKIGDVGSLKDPLKKFTKGQAVQNLKTNSINTLADKANTFTNQFFNNLQKNLK